MMMNRVIFLFFLLVLASCNPSAKLVKQGDAKSKTGQYEEASTFYYNALLRDPDAAKAKEGLVVSAQMVLDEKFVNFNKLVVANNIDDALKVYKNAERYSQTATSVGVTLRWPAEYDEVFADIRAEYISKLYDEALAQIKLKQYELSEQTFERIANLDTSYRGITVLRINTVLEPLYQHGLIELNQGKYKQAYQIFSKIVQQDENYKNAKQLRDEANDKATTTVGILPIFYAQKNDLFRQGILGGVISDKLMQKAFSYVKIEPYAETQINLESRGWGEIADIDKAIEAGKTIGLKYVLWIEVSNIAYTEVPLTTEQKNAYEAFSENILNPYTGTYSAITKFRKITYNDSYEKRVLNLKSSYKLINTSDGKTVLNTDKEYIISDEVHQLVYDGNINNVYQELPTGNYLPQVNETWRNLFTNVKRQPITKEQLAYEANQQMAQQISQAMIAFFK